MIDTIRFSLYGITDKVTDVVQAELRKNRKASEYYCLEHNDLYLAMLECNKNLFEMVIFKDKNTGQDSYLDKNDFLQMVSEREHLKGSTLTKDNLRRLYILNYKTVTFVNGEIRNTIDSNPIGKYRLTSQSSNVTFKINKNKGCITFELSVPKYLFGHNLAQFIPQCKSQSYQQNDLKLHNFKFQARLIHKRLIQFFDIFFNDLCHFFKLEQIPNLKFTTIDRLDLCFNQYFDSKSDAMAYLKYQQQIAHKVKNNIKQGGRDFATSVSYKTAEGNFFKIYHKGSEYESKDGDLKKHRLINMNYIDKLMSKKTSNDFYKQFRHTLFSDYMIGLNKSAINDKDFNYFKTLEFRQAEISYLSKVKDLKAEKRKELSDLNKFIRENEPINVQFLKNEMDKVLRYELTFRGNFMRYHYKMKLFRNKCDIHQKYLANYLKVKKYFDFRVKSQEVPGLVSKKNYEIFNKWLNKQPIFFLDAGANLKDYENNGHYNFNIYDNLYKVKHYDVNFYNGKNTAIFTKPLMTICVNTFKKMIDRYQIKGLDFTDDLSVQIDKRNAQAKINLEKYNRNSFNISVLDSKKMKFKLKNNGAILMNKRGKEIMIPSELLTYKQKQDLGLVGFSKSIILNCFNYLKSGGSLDEYRYDYDLSNSQFCRLKSQLEKFKIYQSTFIIKKPIRTKVDFSQYYQTTNMAHYRRHFFNNMLINSNPLSYE